MLMSAQATTRSTEESTPISRPSFERTRNNNSNSSRSNRNKDLRDNNLPTVRLSKALAWLLRHNAEAQGVAIRPDGYVKIEDVLKHPKFKGYTFDDIVEVVNTNDKKRFQILEDYEENKKYIRAVQGHSIPKVAELDHEEITDASQLPVAVHGTSSSKWELIKSKGLSRMNRNHIHLAVGLPGEDGVISGMRQGSDLYIYIDITKALRDGIKFYRTANNVILSDGQDGNGVIMPQYFARVVKSSGEVIYPDPSKENTTLHP